METMNKDIREQNFKSVYLLYGTEDYLCRQYKRRLKNAMVDPADTMNCAFFEGKDIPIPELLDLADTMPFLAPRRVIVVEDSGFFKNGQEKLAEFFTRIPPTTHFIFLETEVNNRQKHIRKQQSVAILQSSMRCRLQR